MDENEEPIGPGLIWLDVAEETARRFGELLDQFDGATDDEQMAALLEWIEQRLLDTQDKQKEKHPVGETRCFQYSMSKVATA